MSELRVLQVALPASLTTGAVDHLEQWGHAVTAENTTNGRDGLDRLRNSRFESVLFPADLPEMDGLAFLYEVREIQPDVPAIMVADQGQEALVEAALDAGVTECVRTTGQTDHAALLAKRIHDAVERDRIEAERDETQRFVDQLFEHVPVSLYVKDEAARHVRLSSFYGVDPEVAKGKTDKELYSYKAEESYRDDMRVIQTGEPILDKVEHLPVEDEWNMTSKAPWYGADGQIKGLIGVTWRITEQKEYERELKEQSKRLNRFTRIVSHELRNPIQVARGRAELLQTEYDVEHTEDIIKALDRMSELIADLHALARGGQDRMDEEFSLTDAAEKCWQTGDWDDGTLRIDCDATLHANREQLEQLLENLFDNAVRYGGEGVTVTVGRCESASGFYVADDGPGIPESERADVFEAGYSTGGERTGFGLATVAAIAAGHGWEIDVRASEDGGARFDITGVEFDE